MTLRVRKTCFSVHPLMLRQGTRTGGLYNLNGNMRHRARPSGVTTTLTHLRYEIGKLTAPMLTLANRTSWPCKRGGAGNSLLRMCQPAMRDMVAAPPNQKAAKAAAKRSGLLNVAESVVGSAA